MSIPPNAPISLPKFGGITVHVPDYYVLPGKKPKQFKLVSGLTPSRKQITTRQGHKAIKVMSNERNELYLEEKDYGNPRIEYSMFSPKDQKILQKYFASELPGPKKAHIEPPNSPTSTITHASFDEETDTLLPSGKRKYNVRKSYEEVKADQKQERNTMASEDSRRIARMARIASKKK